MLPHNQLRRNRADHNYYGFLVTSWSNYNNITDNLAEDNSRSEIITGFGIGFSLQENSSHNIMIRNTAKRNFNGLEVSKGCQFNAVYDNNASENKHGIRLNENRNNLIFGNNFYNNDINAYENTSLNVWNTTLGNYYSDYRGKDENGDGIGDQPYSLPGPESKSLDRPAPDPSQSRGRPWICGAQGRSQEIRHVCTGRRRDPPHQKGEWSIGDISRPSRLPSQMAGIKTTGCDHSAVPKR